jgi:hypothetical protein
MWKRDPLVQTRATQSFALDQSFKNVFAGDMRDRANQQLAEDFQAMFLAACLCIAQDAVGLDDFFEQHG